MRGALLAWGGVVLAVVSLQASSPQSSLSIPGTVSQHRLLLNTYCVSCHSQTVTTAGLNLNGADIDKIDSRPEVWEKVLGKLRAGTMPPAGRPRPDKTAYSTLIGYLEAELDRTAALNPNPGRSSIHRLNRAEYANAVRDLLDVEIDAESLLPIDELNHGFDNIGDVLSVSPVLLERYMSAAGKISRLAVGDAEVRSYYETYTLPALLNQDERLSEDLPFGSRGGIAIRHHFPVDGEYTIRIRLQRNSRDYIRGLADRHQLDVRLDGQRVTVFPVGGESKGKSGPAFSQAAQIGDPLQEEYEHGGAEEHLEVRFPAKAGTHVVGVTFVNKTSVPEGVFQPPIHQFDVVQYKGGNPALDTVTIGGPFVVTGVGDTPSRRKVFTCTPSSGDEQACAQKILSSLGRRAYRRPLTSADLNTLLSFFKLGAADGGFEAGIQSALERILVGPEFLFRVERDPKNVAPDSSYRISDLELASRLSFFLWSSIPDDQLLDAAAGGKLKDPVVLEQQVKRMLADPKSRSLVTNFAGQWLYLRNIRSATPDPGLFPYFDENLRSAFLQETELFIDSTLRENRSVLDLLTADYTFLNERLAEHYGIPNVYGSHFRRVKFGDDKRRGLLGQGSILTVTSYANRTSVVLRGKWLLENILGAPPPPPPPNVPDLKETDASGKALPLRQLMEQHRSNPACTACHFQMDPLGFALENFDAIGQWRTVDANAPIEATAELSDGTKFDGPAGLRKILLGKPDQFVTTVTEKLLTYALGRGLEYYDAPAMRKIVREAASNDYRWENLILGVVKSTPFQMRRSQKS